MKVEPMRERYVELHSLEFDIEHSDCRDCEFRKKEGCQYYFNKCPQGE